MANRLLNVFQKKKYRKETPVRKNGTKLKNVEWDTINPKLCLIEANGSQINELSHVSEEQCSLTFHDDKSFFTSKYLHLV